MKTKKINKNKISNKRLKIYMVGCFVVFLALLLRIFYFQFIKGSELKESAYKQQTTNKLISAKRGAIYDSTGKSLAISASVDTVSVTPGRVKYSNSKLVDNEVLAKAFSEIFELDYSTILEDLNTSSSIITIAKKVEKDKIDLLKTWMEENKVSSGINIDEDTKRYYPYGSLASNLIGFTGTDNQGLAGLESSWDTILTGTPGKIVATLDSIRQEIPNQQQTFIPAENGSDIVLTLDVTIQSIADKYLKQAVIENSADGGNVIIMKPSSGDILAMSTYPNYDLNTPFEPYTDNLKENWSTLSSEEKSNLLYSMWKNSAVSSTYEPGSTFKILTAAIGLEEGLVSTDNNRDFLCTGSHTVLGIPIRCWRNYDPHQYQSLRTALANSCNPAFMQLGEKITAKTLYKYYEAFGLFKKTDAGFYAESSSIFHDLEDVTALDLATMSFGQRFTITPIQLITAVSSIVNNGNLIQPRIVKEIKNSNTGTVTTLEPKKIRQIISKQTSEEMLSMLETVVTSGTGTLANIPGYSIGGKSGTSEPIVGSDSGYVASFIAVTPITNPEIVVLVIIYNPSKDNYHGGQVAGPVVSQILSEVLPYLGISSDFSNENYVTDEDLVILPDVKNKTVSEAKKLLKTAGFSVQFSSDEDENSTIITNQMPKPGVSLLKNSLVYLYTNENNVGLSVNVPNLKGMNASQAINTLKANNLNISITGSGIVITQDIPNNTSVEQGTIINVTLKNELNGGY